MKALTGGLPCVSAALLLFTACSSSTSSLLLLGCAFALPGKPAIRRRYGEWSRTPAARWCRKATITITNDATGISDHRAHATTTGMYILTGLRPAVYTIRAEGAGISRVGTKECRAAGRPADEHRFHAASAGSDHDGGGDGGGAPAGHRERGDRHRCDQSNMCATFHCTAATCLRWYFWRAE